MSGVRVKAPGAAYVWDARVPRTFSVAPWYNNPWREWHGGDPWDQPNPHYEAAQNRIEAVNTNPPVSSLMPRSVWWQRISSVAPEQGWGSTPRHCRHYSGDWETITDWIVWGDDW